MCHGHPAGSPPQGFHPKGDPLRDLNPPISLLYNPMLMAGLIRFLSVLAWVGATSGAPVLAQPAAQPLSVTSAGPAGEIGSLAEANEIRVRFSEPMVSLGRIPA